MNPASQILELKAGSLSAGINANLGGALLWLSSLDGNGDRWNWMRAMPQGHSFTPREEVLNAACFPLVPFSNRIENAAFRFKNQSVHLQPNWPGNMSIHGIGWQRAWRVQKHSDTELVLGLQLERPDWPWQAGATLIYSLRADGLSMTLNLQNMSDDSMPSGLGFHPYFPKTAETGLLSNCHNVVLTDDRQIPNGLLTDHSALRQLTEGMLPAPGFDNALTGWDGNATITWAGTETQPSRRMVITTEPETEFAVLYVPEELEPSDEPFFCFEPVTHIPNAHNLQDDRYGPSGLLDLPPGAIHTFTADFAIG